MSIKPFTRLKGNIKNQFDEALAPVTLWLGENQTGKTGRLIGVKIAAQGPAASHGGVKGSDIMRLVPEGIGGAFALLESPSGSCELKVDVEGRKARTPVHTRTGAFLEMSDDERARMLPLVSMADLLTLGPDRGRRALVQRFGEGDKLLKPRKLRPEQKALWDDVVEAVTKDRAEDADPAQILAAVQQELNSRKLDAGKRFRALEQSLAAREEEVNATAAGAEQLDELREAYTVALAWENAAGLRVRLEKIEEQKADYRERQKPFAEADANREAREAEEKSQRDAILVKLEAAMDVVGTAAEEVADQQARAASGANWTETLHRAADLIDEGAEARCPLCTSTVVASLTLDALMAWDGSIDEFKSFIEDALASFDPLKVLEERILPAVERRQKSLESAETAEREARAASAALQTELDDFDRALNRARTDDATMRARMRAEAERITAVAQEVQHALEISKAPATYDGASAAELRVQIDTLEAADRARERLELDTEEMRQAEVERDLAKWLENATKKLLTDLVADLKKTAEEAVNRYMKDEQAVIDLEKSAWNVIGKDGRPHGRHEQCGYELCSLVPALACAYTEGAPARYLVLDDDDLRGFSKRNLKKLLSLLVELTSTGVLTQVFMAHSWLTPDDVPDGVMVHHLGTAGKIGVHYTPVTDTSEPGEPEPDVVVAPTPVAAAPAPMPLFDATPAAPAPATEPDTLGALIL